MKRIETIAFAAVIALLSGPLALADFCDIHWSTQQENPKECREAMSEAVGMLVQRDHPTTADAKAELLAYSDLRCETAWWPDDETREDMADVVVGMQEQGELRKYIVFHLHFKRADGGIVEVRTSAESTQKLWKPFLTNLKEREWRQAWCMKLYHSDEQTRHSCEKFFQKLDSENPGNEH